MIQIIIDNQNAELRENTEIEFTLNNPFLNNEYLSPGSYTMPFELAGVEDSPTNAKIFNFPNVIENLTVFPKKNATLSFAGIPFRTGKIKAHNTSNKGIKTNFIFGMRNVHAEIRTMRLRDVLNEQVVIDSTPFTKKIYIKPGTAGGSPYTIIVNDEEYSATTLSALATAINSDTEAKNRAIATYHATGSPSDSTVTGPYIEIKSYTDTSVLAPLSVKVPGNNGDANSGYKWVQYVPGFNYNETYYNGFHTYLYPYLHNDEPNDGIRFPFRFNANMYGENEISYFNPYGLIKRTDHVNAINVGGNIITNSPDVTGTRGPFLVNNVNSLQPFIQLKYVIDKVFQALGVGVDGDFYNDPAIEKKLIDNTYALDVPMDFIGEQKFVFWRRDFNKRELVTDISVLEFLEALQSRFNLGIAYNEITGKVELRYNEVIAKTPATHNLTPFCSPIEEIDDQTIEGVVLVVPAEENDALSIEERSTIGSGGDERIMKCGGILTNKTYNAMTGVYVSQPQNSKFGLRLFNYEGYNTDNNYVACSIDDRLNYLFTGIYPKYWKRWLSYELTRREVPLTAELDWASIVSMKWDEKKIFDRNEYLLHSIKFKLTHHGVQPATINLLTC